MRFNCNDLQIFETIGDFNIGKGQFSLVKLASYPKQPDLPPIVLKQFKKSRVVHESLGSSILNELNVMNQIEHPFIVSMFGTSQDQKHIYLVLEFIQGCELFSRIRSLNSLPENASRFYASEILLVLEYLHSQNIAFRDLKPENLLITKSGHIKLIDFSFAKFIIDKTFTICGTPEYLAPEIIRKDGHDATVDYWALGILIYEMLVGHPPFLDNNPLRIFNKILEGKYFIPNSVSPCAADLISKLLNPDPAERIGSREPVRSHPWFQDVDFQGMIDQTVKTPWKPWLQGNGASLLYEDSAEEGEQDFEDDIFVEF